MSECTACLNGCGGARSDCPMAEWRPVPVTGRPSTYSRDMADRICAELASGKSLKAICDTPGMPPRSTVQGWVIDDVDGLSGRYARARDIGLEIMADETLEIADDGRSDLTITPDGREVVNSEVVQRSRLRVDTRKWLLSKRLPKTYGDKSALEVSGPGGGPITLTWQDGST